VKQSDHPGKISPDEVLFIGYLDKSGEQEIVREMNRNTLISSYLFFFTRKDKQSIYSARNAMQY
jgi:hypothetical protein